jgi:hypothetical protein
MYLEELPFKVVRVNGHDEVVARAVNLIIGQAAYETARRLYESERVVPQRCPHHCHQRVLDEGLSVRMYPLNLPVT